jgi:hypothetical protein
MALHVTTTAIVCPKSDKNEAPVVIDLTNIYKIEGRIQEVAYVNNVKAPELLARFNEVYLELDQHLCMLRYEHLKAKHKSNKVRSIVLLDKVRDYLKEKGLLTANNKAGSEDLRNAVLDQDQEYQDSLEVLDQIKCTIELLEGKQKAFEMAFSSVKKIIGDSYLGNNYRNPGTGMDQPTTFDDVKKAEPKPPFFSAPINQAVDANLEEALENKEISPVRAGFGKAKY